MTKGVRRPAQKRGWFRVECRKMRDAPSFRRATLTPKARIGTRYAVFLVVLFLVSVSATGISVGETLAPAAIPAGPAAKAGGKTMT